MYYEIDEDEYYDPREDYEEESLCSSRGCNRPTIGEGCSQCGAALCSMCYESGASFCASCPTDDFAEMYAQMHSESDS